VASQSVEGLRESEDSKNSEKPRVGNGRESIANVVQGSNRALSRFKVVGSNSRNCVKDSHPDVQDHSVQQELSSRAKPTLVSRGKLKGGRKDFPVDSRRYGFVVCVEKRNGPQVLGASRGVGRVLRFSSLGSKDHVLVIEARGGRFT